MTNERAIEILYKHKTRFWRSKKVAEAIETVLLSAEKRIEKKTVDNDIDTRHAIGYCPECENPIFFHVDYPEAHLFCDRCGQRIARIEWG